MMVLFIIFTMGLGEIDPSLKSVYLEPLPTLFNSKTYLNPNNMNDEKWRHLECLQGFYMISNHGRIKSLTRTITCNSGAAIKKGIILKQTDDGRGYPRIRVSFNGAKKSFRIHRLVGMAFIENPKNKPQINHIDCDKQNNHYSNLEWSTNQENHTHAVDNNLYNNPTRGVNHWKTKLVVSEVLSIRKMYKTKEYTQQEIADIVGCNRRNVSDIVIGKTWKHV